MLKAKYICFLKKEECFLTVENEIKFSVRHLCSARLNGQREIVWTHTHTYTSLSKIWGCKQMGVRKKKILIRKKKFLKKEEEKNFFNNLFYEVHTLQIQPRYHTRGNEKMLRFERTNPLFPLLDTFHVFPPTLRLKDMPSETQRHA